jgi:hypothetical protein
MLLRESNDTRLSIDLPHNFPCGHFQLSGDGDFVPARHARRASASELPRTKTSQNGELERRELSWTLYHREPSFRDPACDSTQRMTGADGTVVAAVVALRTSAAGEGEGTLDMQPSQQGFGEGWAGMAEGSEKQEASLYADREDATAPYRAPGGDGRPGVGFRWAHDCLRVLVPARCRRTPRECSDRDTEQMRRRDKRGSLRCRSSRPVEW